MNMTLIEKVLLTNQYEILRRLEPSMEPECELILKCLYDGYEADLEQLLPSFEPNLDDNIRQEVREILEMFRALKPRFDIEAVASFVGFDGNEETEHYTYAVFLIEDRGLWRESRRDDYNTHYPALDDYREMLKRWNGTANKRHLTSEEMLHIAQVAPAGSSNLKAA